jgi:hypothetical protein
MPLYICKHCQKEFSQKCHYDAHKNKKKPCKLCPKHFTTQYVYIEDICIHINDYDENIHKNPKCQNGHDLIKCQGNHRRLYFKHKNSCNLTENNDYEMSEWHCQWQGFFPRTEVEFEKLSEKQIKNRRADVLLNAEYILEVQHSVITEAEVICRVNDYKEHNKNIIWIIDGNTSDVELIELNDGTFLIEFNHDWKYSAFKHSYDYVLLDINEKIFKIAVKSVCNKMFHANTHHHVDNVVNHLQQAPNRIWDLWEDTNEIQPYLRIEQKGAGNGKTFGIWKSIVSNKDKNLFIITTKQHTAKEVILEELNNQAERNEFHIIDNITYDKENDIDTYGKQYIVTYEHIHSKRTCTVIIGTIDSFIWSLTTHDTNIIGKTYFESLLNTICNNNRCDKVNSYTGEITYAGKKRKLNRLVELWIDESQDLEETYIKAVIILIMNTKISCVVVGDKLQSLTYDINFMTNLGENNTNLNIINTIPENKNRRIKVKHMIEKINQLVHFRKYNLPEIETDQALIDHGEDVIETIEQQTIYANDTNTAKIDNEVDKIIAIVEKEVEKYDYSPKDFLFIFPIMKSNILACELETKLNNFWLERLGNCNKYTRYAILHKHEEGVIIDTSKSKNASRIMSIKSSKGDGRKVVFILNCTEASLKIVSNYEKGLIYESHFHVALTRAMNKIYFGLIKNNDDIHKRFSELSNVEFIPKIRSILTIDSISPYIDKENLIGILKQHITPEIKSDSKNDNSIIDWEYHCIRRAVYHTYALFEIFKHNQHDFLFDSSQIKTVLDMISRLPIKPQSPRDFYEYIKEKERKREPLDVLPLCILSNKQYEELCSSLQIIIQGIQKKYKNNNLSLGELNTLECTVLIYIIDIFKNKQYHEITPTTIYNILNCYKNPEDAIVKLISESKNMKTIVKQVMEQILPNERIKWNIMHKVFYDGNVEKDSMSLLNNFYIIGFNKTTVYHLVFQTDFNSLNYWDVIGRIILERILILNSSGNDNDINNKTRFQNKKIITFLLILKTNSYERFEWDFEKDISPDIKEILKNAFVKYFTNFNKDLFNYVKFVKSNKANWEEIGGKTYKTPYQFIAKQLAGIHAETNRTPQFIQSFFTNLHIEALTKNTVTLREIKNLTDNEEVFNLKMNEYIKNTCESYFNLGTLDDTSEW